MCDALLWVKCCVIVCAAKQEETGIGGRFSLHPNTVSAALLKTECLHMWKRKLSYF